MLVSGIVWLDIACDRTNTKSRCCLLVLPFHFLAPVTKSLFMLGLAAKGNCILSPVEFIIILCKSKAK